MRDGVEINTDKQRADHYFHETQRLADFLEWLFDTELDYTTQTEMFKKFEAWEDKQNDNGEAGV